MTLAPTPAGPTATPPSGVEFPSLRARRWDALAQRDAPLLLVRFVLLRLLGLVYLAAFLVAALQAVPLLGADGLLPIPDFMERVAAATGSRGSAFLELPTLFWL